MTPRGNSTLRLLSSHATGRRRVRLDQPRQSAPRCRVCKFQQATTPSTATVLQGGVHFPQWQQQLRFFAQESSSSSSSSSRGSNDSAATATLAANDTAADSHSGLDATKALFYDSDNKKSSSLHANIHYILKRIPIGRLSNDHLSEARSFLSIASKWHNEQGATLSEALLERLYKESQSSARRRNQHFLEEVTVDEEMYNVCMDAWNKSGVEGQKIVERVEGIMERMDERYSRSCNTDSGDYPQRSIARPDRYGYNCLINAYSKWDEDCTHKVESILKKMIILAEEAASSDNSKDREYAPRIRPDAYTYNSLMNYHATRKYNPSSAQRAEDLLLKMSELSKQRENDIRMDVTSFNTVLKAWSNSGGGMDGAQRAESVLRMMMKLSGEGGHENVRPDAKSFSTVIDAYSKVEREDGALSVQKVMELLDELEGMYFPDGSSVNSCYNAAAKVIVKCVSSKEGAAVERVRELMHRMKNMDAVPDGNLLTSLIEAYTKEGTDESLAQGREMLMEMMDGPEPELEPSVVPFNILLDATLKGNASNKLDQADELMATMETLGGNARPDTWSYNMMISALSRSPTKESEDKAVGYLKSMLKSYREGYEKAKPDSFVFNCIINMLARSNSKESTYGTYQTLKAMENQQKSGNTAVVPDTITYNTVLGKLARSPTKENAKKALSLLESMEEGKEVIAPDILTYTTMVRLQEKVGDTRRAATIASSYLERAMSKEGEKIHVDRFGLGTLLVALSKSQYLVQARTARRSWEQIEEQEGLKDDEGENNGSNHLLNAELCNLILLAYSNASVNDAKDKFDVVAKEAAEDALSFLSERISRYQEGSKKVVLPTVVGFSATLMSLGKANRIDDALRLLQIMNVLRKDGVPNIELDDGCYISILSPLARYQPKSAASQALRVIKHMKDDSGTVSTAVLNAAINVCARTDEYTIAKRKAVEVAFELLRLGRGSDSCVDDVTYGLMIRTCMDLTDDEVERIKLVEPLFKLCAKSGLVGKMVMGEVKHLWKRLVRDQQPLPIEWTMNAKDKWQS